MTKQGTQAYAVQQVPDRAIRQQRASYIALLPSLGPASFEEIQEVLDERDEVEPEKGLNPQAIEKLQKRIDSPNRSQR